MPNLFTRVPERPVPPLPGPVRTILPVADLFMVLMASRPPSGTLRDTWVTPATFWLALASAVVLAGAAVPLARTGAAIGVVAAVACALLGLGALSVVVVGAAQKTAR